ncbi:MAG: YihA family ribosome biogenesis GTP-binding protein [Bacteroidaceae bacterium]|nr:YihA family ribosome biogenesis GTP-binding protein [Bacteroidaceae bacterium]MEE1287915.1 ribosome biogenesis GTP-binding protein YihA/YsxC [Bacteroidaceae bacterium]
MTIRTAEYLISSAKVEQCPKAELPEYAFIGRSNVGKSSLINMLADNNKLAKTSATPGKTILINHFLINRAPEGKMPTSPADRPWYLVDLPGYGYAKRSKKDQENFEHMISSYILEREQMTLLFLLIDVRLEPQKIDLEFIEWLGENGVPFAIIFTKADKVSKGRLGGNVQHYLKELSKQWEELPPHFVTSSENSMGREELLQYIGEVNGMVQEA